MKIENQLLSLNQEHPDWESIQIFLQSPQLQNLLVDFLHLYSRDSIINYELENIAVHSLKILCYLQDERALPFIVEFLNYSAFESEDSWDDSENNRTPSFEEYSNVQSIYPSQPSDNAPFHPIDYGYSDSVILACKQGIELLSTHKKFIPTFWTLFKVTLDKELAYHYLTAAMLSHLYQCKPGIKERIIFPMKANLKKSFKENFFIDPYMSSYVALVYLDTDFLPYLERVIQEQIKIFPDKTNKNIENDLFSHLGQIPLTWFVLHQIHHQNYLPIQDHIDFFILDDPLSDFELLYQNPQKKMVSKFTITPQKDVIFRKKLIKVFYQHFPQWNQFLPSPPIPTAENNVVPLFRN